MAAVDYCDAQGAASVADLVERASRLIAHQQAVSSYRLGIWSSWPWAVALQCPCAWPWRLLVKGVTVLGWSRGDGFRPIPFHQPYRLDLLDGLVASLALKPVPTKRLLISLNVTPTTGLTHSHQPPAPAL